MTLHAVGGVLNTDTDTRNIKASVLHLLQLHSPHAVQIIICINLNLLYLLNCRTLVFQFLIDGLRDFIADILNGRPDFSQVETTARYLGTGLYWIAASINIRPGYDYYFYVRSVNTVGK
ncbi:phage tail tip protein J-related protein, partial [Bacillus sp. HC-TM]